MKKTKMSDLINLSADELVEKISKLKKELMQFRFQAKMGKLERQTSIRETRRDIARMMTALSALKLNTKKAEVKS